MGCFNLVLFGLDWFFCGFFFIGDVTGLEHAVKCK